MIDAGSGFEKETASLEVAVSAVEAAAKRSFVYIAPPCFTASQLQGQRQEIDARHRADIAPGSGQGYHQFEEAQQEMERMREQIAEQARLLQETNLPGLARVGDRQVPLRQRSLSRGSEQSRTRSLSGRIMGSLRDWSVSQASSTR